MKARHQELTRKRSQLSADLDSQLQLSKALYDSLDGRISILGSKLVAIEASAVCGGGDGSGGTGGDDQLTLIEQRNIELKQSSQNLMEQQLQRNSASLFLQKKQRKNKPTTCSGGGYCGGGGPGEGVTMTAVQLKKQRELSSKQYSAAGGVTGGSIPADSNEPLYCICRNVFFGEMVGCDDPDCVIEWFHFGCVGLTEAPDQWFCPDCTAKRAAKRAASGATLKGGAAEPVARGAKGKNPKTPEKNKGKEAGTGTETGTGKKKRGRPPKGNGNSVSKIKKKVVSYDSSDSNSTDDNRSGESDSDDEYF